MHLVKLINNYNMLEKKLQYTKCDYRAKKNSYATQQCK
jgi:hypothetical protein